MADNHKPQYTRGGCPRAKLDATNWLADISGTADFPIVEVAFKNTRTAFFTNPDQLDLKIGDMVAVESQPGYDIGRVNMTGRLVKLQMKRAEIKDDTELKRVLHTATVEELKRADEAHSREHSTMIRARRIAEDLSLNMKIGDVEYQADAAKAIFYYIADERVDFRTLIRVLADTFKVRVEMRQIGARQEAGRIGGIGPCGRPLCCSSWLTKFVSVGTGAARVQDLSMNPQKLAGQCAKLKCCLNFETPVYAEAQKKMPHRDVQLETKDSTYWLFKSDILAHIVTYSTDKKIPANLVTIDASRAFEVIALNKQGVKPDSLLPDSEQQHSKEQDHVDLVEQESLTRFDKSKSKKRRKGKTNVRKSPDVKSSRSEEKGADKGHQGEGRRRNRGREQKKRES